MIAAVTVPREAALASETSRKASVAPERAELGTGVRRRGTPPAPQRYASDDEILGIQGRGALTHPDESPINNETPSPNAGAEPAAAEYGTSGDAPIAADRDGEPQLEAALDAHPDLRQAWQDVQSYREAFATPEAARAAMALLGDLNRMDALFFSRRPEDHAELARAIASLDPAAFASLAEAMNGLAASANGGALDHAASMTPSKEAEKDQSWPAQLTHDPAAKSSQARVPLQTGQRTDFSPSAAQVEFLNAANAAAVQGLLDSIETQVDRLLPEGVSKSARNRVIGEIYRELDASLGANRQLGQQMRDAFRSGNLDSAHQSAIVSLVTGRARQALPGIAKRVLNEWTSTVVAANQDRLARQRAAAHRVDIAGSGRGGDGARRSLGPRDIDYARMSDSDILNL